MDLERARNMLVRASIQGVCMASQDIKATLPRSLSYKGVLRQCGARGWCSLAAIHWALAVFIVLRSSAAIQLGGR